MTIKDFKKNILLAFHTTFKIGGEAKYFFEAKTKKDLIDAIKTAKKNNLRFFILSAGSNVLFLDEGFDGLVIKNSDCKLNVLKDNKEVKIEAGAGVLLSKIVEVSVNNSLSGFEWAIGIPGRVGGSVFGNAQAFKKTIADSIKEVEVFDTKILKIKKILKKDCDFSEKNSIFKKNKNLIILSVVFELKKGKKEDIRNLIKKYIKTRKEKQPLDYNSAGSFFVNKDGQKPSSYLIEKAGLKGKRIANAQVSEKHAGFIVNLGGASAKDVLELIKIIKKQVKDKFGVELEEEVQIIK